MADLELVEKLRERADVTYDEAKEALDACDDDLLEAVIYLEKKGKVPSPKNGGAYSSRQTGSAEEEYTAYTKPKTNVESFSELMSRFWDWIVMLLRKGRDNQFVVRRNCNVICSVPVLALILLLIFCFWGTLIALVVGLFMSCRYSIKGTEVPEEPEKGRNINTVMDEVAEATESLKNEFMANHFNDKP